MKLKAELEKITELRKEYRGHSMDIPDVFNTLDEMYKSNNRLYPFSVSWDFDSKEWVMVVAWPHKPIVIRNESILQLVLNLLCSMEKHLNELSAE